MGLDQTDLEIVRQLELDGRLPFEGLASRVGLSRAAVRLRVRRLVDSGAIRLVGVVHPRVRGMTAHAHLSIDVDSDVAPVAEAVADLPETALVNMTAGRFPLAAELHGRSLRELGEAVERVRALPGIVDVDTAIYTDILKDPQLPDPAPPGLDLDLLDHRVLELLERDGRLSFADLAAEVELSAGAVRSRVLRLLETSAIRVTALVDPGAVGLASLGGFALRLSRSAPQAIAELASWEQTRFLARCVGRADLLGTVAAESTSGLHLLYERLRALPGVRVTETWVHMSSVRDRYANRDTSRALSGVLD
ncbi:Lrp/AsnC family transcriptional regulator [Nocardiopsis ansamitocini]|uniref:HTH asnC-type domain-containing protein n=1 Tax=Nocardiopsis ansamitocini TaxID=1670832 RepID=A0A9W6UI54_9ACTN|nr:Lrp/AsnC family transcriptional regulator [Nocardiopsis ansamitocini]GLU47058.1 hypothetical protein Nans01_14090 [Nocardiopsis ansamitocini]